MTLRTGFQASEVPHCGRLIECATVPVSVPYCARQQGSGGKRDARC